MHGPHPRDQALFGDAQQRARIGEAAGDLRYLLGRGYARPGALRLVGDRYQLASRQRQLLFRAVCAPQAAERTRAVCVPPARVRGAPLVIDGHNVLITLETAAAGGLVLRCDDGFLRDIAERHGAYRQSAHTARALALLAEALGELKPGAVRCYLDRPVAFSGLLAESVRRALGAAAAVEVVDSPDFMVKHMAGDLPDAVAATSDSGILGQVAAAFDLAGWIVARRLPDAWVFAM